MGYKRTEGSTPENYGAIVAGNHSHPRSRSGSSKAIEVDPDVEGFMLSTEQEEVKKESRNST